MMWPTDEQLDEILKLINPIIANPSLENRQKILGALTNPSITLKLNIADCLQDPNQVDSFIKHPRESDLLDEYKFQPVFTLVLQQVMIKKLIDSIIKLLEN